MDLMTDRILSRTGKSDDLKFELRHSGSEPPVLLVGKQDALSSLEEGVRAGAKGYLIMPVPRSKQIVYRFFYCLW